MAVGVDPRDERFDRPVAGESGGGVAGAADTGERQVGVFGQLRGGEDGLVSTALECGPGLVG
jgi:hypothetical protein